MATPTKTQPAIRVNTTTQGDQSAPAAAKLADGRFVVVWGDGRATWNDPSEMAIRGQILGSDGARSGTEFPVNTTTLSNQSAPHVAALEGGGFVVVWRETIRNEANISISSARGQVFGDDGSAIGEEFLVDTPLFSNQMFGSAAAPQVAGLAGGGFVVALGMGYGRASIQIFDATAMPTSAEIPLPGQIYSDTPLSILPASDGGFVLGRDLHVDENRSSFTLTSFSADGMARISDLELVPPGLSGDHVLVSSQGILTPMADGRMLLLWRDLSPLGRIGDEIPIRGQFLATDGTKEGDSFVITTEAEGYMISAQRSVTALPDGGFAVAWVASVGASGSDDAHRALQLRLFDASGASAGEIITLNPRIDGYPVPRPALLTLPNERIVAIWGDGEASDTGVRAQIFNINPYPLITGTDGADTLTGSALSDVIEGYGGDDLLQGGDGYDTLFGGDGNDTLQGGGGGFNRLFGDDGNDLIFAGPDGDFIGGGAGDDIIRGGAGRDTIYGGYGNDNIGGGAGNDVIYGAAGHNLIWGGLGDDMIYGAWGSDTIYGGGDGTNTIFGGDGDDVLIAGAGGDFINAGPGDDIIAGGAGPDTILGGDGDDWIYGQGDFSRLEGGNGDDRIEVTGDNSTVFGGDGDDHIILRNGSHQVFGGDGDDHVTAASGNQRIFGEAGHDTIISGTGDDFIGGGAGNDLIYGGAGNDTIWGGFGSDTIYGGAGDDLIFASAGSGNVLYGGVGNDTMVASIGRDVMHSQVQRSGSGWAEDADVFVFNSAAHIGIGPQRDIIFNFVSGEDRIDLRALDTQFNGTAGLLGGDQASFYHFTRPGMMSDLLIGDSQGNGAADWVLEVNFSSYWISNSSWSIPDTREFLESDFIL